MKRTIELIRKVKRIELRVRSPVEGLLQGAYHSKFKGRGIEFSEVREYQPGDDIRTIDWKVSARMGKPFIKEFSEERDLTMFILLDASASLGFGREKSKYEQAILMSSSLMLAALRNNDRIGLLSFNLEEKSFHPARKGRKHLLKLIRYLTLSSPKGKSSLREGISFFLSVVKKKSIVFVVSDFYDELPKKEFLMLRKRHEVVALKVYDESEMNLEDMGTFAMEDMETGEQLFLSTDEEFLSNYSQLVKEENEKTKSFFKKMGIPLINASTDEPFDVPLRRYFKGIKGNGG